MIKQVADIRDVFGFDLGDGESALAICPFSGVGEPDVLKIIDGQQSFLTCIGRDAHGRVLLGEQALEASQVHNARLTFKRCPSEDDGTSRALAADFFCEVMKRAGAAGCDLTRARIIVGHPSAWSQADVTTYVKVLANTNDWQVKGISESRAAFLQLKESKKIPAAELRASTLIVDIGSSTTDFTLIKNLSQQPIDFGHNALGGRLIDRAILAHQVEGDQKREKLNRAFSENTHLYAMCEHSCRVLKEKYFRREVELRTSGDALRSNSVDIDHNTVFRATIDASVMDSILSVPHGDLGGQGWREAFRSALYVIHKRCAAFGELPRTIGMTGGGSRMAFTHEICAAVFPGVNLIMDPTPEFCIVKGLARAGLWDIRAERLRSEIDPLCDLLPKAFDAESHHFLSEVVPLLSKDFVANVMRIGLTDWRSGKVSTLNALETHIRNLAGGWTNGKSVKAIVQRASQRWTERALVHVIPTLQDVTRRYGLPFESLNMSVDSSRPLGLDISAGPGITASDIEPLSLAIGGLAGVIGAKIAAVVTPIVIVILMKGGIIAAATAGPLGWLIGAAIVVAAAIIGKEKAEASIKDWHLYKWLREKILSDEKIDDACSGAGKELERTLNAHLKDATIETLVRQASAVVREELVKKMEQAVVLINR